MIKDSELQAIFEQEVLYTIPKRPGMSLLAEMAYELIRYREASRTDSSWDDAPKLAKARKRNLPAPAWTYYDAQTYAKIAESKAYQDELEERPK